MNLQREGTPRVSAGNKLLAHARKQESSSAQTSIPHEPPALSLDERGMIQWCNKPFESLLGFRRSELIWQHVSKLLPEFADIELVQNGQVNPRLNYLCHCGHLYETQSKDGDIFLASLALIRIEHNGKKSIRMIVRFSQGEKP